MTVPGYVPCPGRSPESHHQRTHRHRSGSPVRILPTALASAAGPIPPRWSRCRRATITQTTDQPGRHPANKFVNGSSRLRLDLASQGLDAGPVTIAWHLEQEGHRPPSTSTIRGSCTPPGLITPEPRKRPRSSYRRFAAAQPNECWQSDFTHWRLADGTDVEILNWLDDHSRYLLGCTAHTPVTGDIVDHQLPRPSADEHGLPASTLTDNGRVYTARFGGGKQRLRIPPRSRWASHRRTATPATPKPKARSNGSTRP